MIALNGNLQSVTTYGKKKIQGTEAILFECKSIMGLTYIDQQVRCLSESGEL